MSVKRAALTIGFDKNGEAEFGVHLGEVVELPFEKMQELRAMIPVAIAQLEHYWMTMGPPSKAMAQEQRSEH